MLESSTHRGSSWLWATARMKNLSMDNMLALEEKYSPGGFSAIVMASPLSRCQQYVHINTIVMVVAVAAAQKLPL